jgi:hypothetical protein
MAKEHIYVISYTKDDGWKINTELEEECFSNGTIFDTETNEWEYGYLGDGEFHEDEQEITAQLSKALRQMNGED